MKVSVITFSEIEQAQELLWEEFREQNPDLRSPYFSLEFSKQVAAIRDRVYVGVIEEENKVIGFFPFQKNLLNTGKPIGGALSDYHGFILPSKLPYSPELFIQRCGLSTWTFDHLIGSQCPIRDGSTRFARSPGIDISKGFDHYARELKDSGSRFLKEIKRKTRKIEKDVGPLHFSFHSADHKVLQKVFEWKSAQCQRTGSVDFFALEWTRELMERILATHTNQLKGVLTSLYSGDNLIAAHFGMQSKDTLHWWFPVYNTSFEKYSPGMCLLLNLLKSAESEGIHLIDFGKGEQPYKQRLMNTETSIVEGAFTTSLLSRFVQRVKHKICHSPHLTFPCRFLRKWDRMTKYH